MKYAVSSSIVGNIFSVVLAPAVAALYGPEIFGEGMAVLSWAAMLGGVACLGYAQAILVSKTKSDMSNLVVLSTIFSLSIAVVSYFVVSYLDYYKHIDYVYYYVPILVFLIGLCAIISNFLAKSHLDLEYSKFNLLSSLLTPVLRLSGYKFVSVSFFLATRVFSLLLVVVVFFGKIKKNLSYGVKNKRHIIKTFFDYISYFKHALPVSVVHSLTVNSLIIFIFSYYGATVAAYVALSARIVNSSLSSVGDVYRKFSISRFSSDGHVINKYLYECSMLVFMAFVAKVLMYFLLEKCLSIIGDEWVYGIDVIEMTFWYYYTLFSFFVLSYILVVADKQVIILRIKVISVVLIFLSMGILFVKGGVDIVEFMSLLILINCVFLIFVVFYSIKWIVYE